MIQDGSNFNLLKIIEKIDLSPSFSSDNTKVLLQQSDVFAQLFSSELDTHKPGNLADSSAVWQQSGKDLPVSIDSSEATAMDAPTYIQNQELEALLNFSENELASVVADESHYPDADTEKKETAFIASNEIDTPAALSLQTVRISSGRQVLTSEPSQQHNYPRQDRDSRMGAKEEPLKEGLYTGAVNLPPQWWLSAVSAGGDGRKPSVNVPISARLAVAHFKSVILQSESPVEPEFTVNSAGIDYQDFDTKNSHTDLQILKNSVLAKSSGFPEHEIISEQIGKLDLQSGIDDADIDNIDRYLNSSPQQHNNLPWTKASIDSDKAIDSPNKINGQDTDTEESIAENRERKSFVMASIIQSDFQLASESLPDTVTKSDSRSVVSEAAFTQQSLTASLNQDINRVSIVTNHNNDIKNSKNTGIQDSDIKNFVFQGMREIFVAAEVNKNILDENTEISKYHPSTISEKDGISDSNGLVNFLSKPSVSTTEKSTNLQINNNVHLYDAKSQELEPLKGKSVHSARNILVRNITVSEVSSEKKPNYEAAFITKNQAVDSGITIINTSALGINPPGANTEVLDTLSNSFIATPGSSNQNFGAQLVEGMNAVLTIPEGNGYDQISIELTPRELGDITIELSKIDDALEVNIHAANETTANTIRENSGMLQELLFKPELKNIMINVDVSNKREDSNQNERQSQKNRSESKDILTVKKFKLHMKTSAYDIYV